MSGAWLSRGQVEDILNDDKYTAHWIRALAREVLARRKRERELEERVKVLEAALRELIPQVHIVFDPADLAGDVCGWDDVEAREAAHAKGEVICPWDDVHEVLEVTASAAAALGDAKKGRAT